MMSVAKEIVSPARKESQKNKALSRLAGLYGTDEWARILERFETFCMPEPNSGCILWTGSITNIIRGNRPRGVFGLFGIPTLASRVSFTIGHQSDPAECFVCHHCDNSLCVNSQHLYAGDHKTNMRDMAVRRRSFGASQPERARMYGIQFGKANVHARGEGNPKNKLSEQQVLAIRGDRRSSILIGREYGVDRTTVQRIRRGALWKCL